MSLNTELSCLNEFGSQCVETVFNKNNFYFTSIPLQHTQQSTPLADIIQM